MYKSQTAQAFGVWRRVTPRPRSLARSLALALSPRPLGASPPVPLPLTYLRAPWAQAPRSLDLALDLSPRRVGASLRSLDLFSAPFGRKPPSTVFRPSSSVHSYPPQQPAPR
ncbi:MAG: hypothetical protein RR885_06775, partial [Oscillospiraceae bacterium]